MKKNFPINRRVLAGVFLASVLATSAAHAGDDPRISSVTVHDDGTITIYGSAFVDKKRPDEGPVVRQAWNGNMDVDDGSKLVVLDYSNEHVTAVLNDASAGDYKVGVAHYYLDDDGDSEEKDAAHWDLTIGAIGPQGDKGETGDQGIQGETGPQGARGDKGDTGDTGAQGPKGDKGDTGDNGAQGAKGDKGDTGDTGAQGVKGDKGDAGAQGIQGASGPQGPKGDKGDKGDTGAQGAKGDTGDTGDQGETGAKGDQGLKGDKGDTGETGPKGVQGIQGEKGDKGDQGEIGPQGPRGVLGFYQVYPAANGEWWDAYIPPNSVWQLVLKCQPGDVALSGSIILQDSNTTNRSSTGKITGSAQWTTHQDWWRFNVQTESVATYVNFLTIYCADLTP